MNKAFDEGHKMYSEEASSWWENNGGGEGSKQVRVISGAVASGKNCWIKDNPGTVPDLS